MKRRSLLFLPVIALSLGSCFPLASTSTGAITTAQSQVSINTMFSSAATELPSARILKTTGNKVSLLEEGTSLAASATVPLNSQATVAISTTAHQDVDLFGGALTHASAHQLMLDSSGMTRAAILRDLFTGEGANFNAIRIPIGASDFISEEHFFTNCDVEGPADDRLANFTLAHDQELIAVIKEILVLKPDLEILATPWSAPSWMKENAKVSPVDPTGYPLCGGSLKADAVAVYADYLAEFVSAYAAMGIKISQLTIVNEPLVSGVDYPSMYTTPQTALAVSRVLSPKLPVGTELVAYDHNCEDAMYTYLSEEFAAPADAALFPGVAIHGYGSQSIPSALPQLKNLYPDKDIYMTEITEYEHGGSFWGDLGYAAENTSIVPYNLGLSGTLYWNLVLDSHGQPNLGQHSTCYGVVTLDRDEDGSFSYSRNSAYYAMAQVAKFLDLSAANKAWALRLETDCDDLNGAAFATEAGLVEAVLVNTGDSLLTTTVGIAGSYYSFPAEPQSVTTIAVSKGDG